MNPEIRFESKHIKLLDRVKFKWYNSITKAYFERQMSFFKCADLETSVKPCPVQLSRQWFNICPQTRFVLVCASVLLLSSACASLRNEHPQCTWPGMFVAVSLATYNGRPIIRREDGSLWGWEDKWACTCVYFRIVRNCVPRWRLVMLIRWFWLQK